MISIDLIFFKLKLDDNAFRKNLHYLKHRQAATQLCRKPKECDYQLLVLLLKKKQAII